MKSECMRKGRESMKGGILDGELLWHHCELYCIQASDFPTKWHKTRIVPSEFSAELLFSVKFECENYSEECLKMLHCSFHCWTWKKILAYRQLGQHLSFLFPTWYFKEKFVNFIRWKNHRVSKSIKIAQKLYLFFTSKHFLKIFSMSPRVKMLIYVTLKKPKKIWIKRRKIFCTFLSLGDLGSLHLFAIRNA